MRIIHHSIQFCDFDPITFGFWEIYDALDPDYDASQLFRNHMIFVRWTLMWANENETPLVWWNIKNKVTQGYVCLRKLIEGCKQSLFLSCLSQAAVYSFGSYKMYLFFSSSGYVHLACLKVSCHLNIFVNFLDADSISSIFVLFEVN